MRMGTTADVDGVWTQMRLTCIEYRRGREADNRLEVGSGTLAQTASVDAWRGAIGSASDRSEVA